MRPWVKSVLSFFKRIFPFAHNSIEFFQRLDGARCILLGNAVQIREQLREVVRIVLLGKRLPALGEKQIGHAAIFSGYLFSQIPFVLHLFYGTGHTGAGQVQCIAEIRDLRLDATGLQFLNNIQTLDIRGCTPSGRAGSISRARFAR